MTAMQFMFYSRQCHKLTTSFVACSADFATDCDYSVKCLHINMYFVEFTHEKPNELHRKQRTFNNKEDEYGASNLIICIVKL